MKHFRRLWKFFVPLLFYAGIVVFLFGNAINPRESELIYGDDVNHQYWFYRQYIIQSLKDGEIPFWNPYNFGGMPFLSNPIPNMWYPGSWLFLTYPLNTAYSLHFAVHIFLACFGMYLFMKCFVKEIPALFAGLAFGLSGFFVARVWAGHSDMIAAGSWLPFIIRSFYVQVARVLPLNSPIATHKGNPGDGAPRFASPAVKHIIRNSISIMQSCISPAIFLAIQLIAGYQTMAFFTAMVLGVFALVYALYQRSLMPIFQLIIVTILAGLLASIQLLPLYETLSHSVRTMNLTYDWVSVGAETWQSFLMIINPFMFGDKLSYTGIRPNYHEHAAFVGVSTLVLAGIAVLYVFYWASIQCIYVFRKNTSRTSIASVFMIVFVVFLLLLAFSLWMSMAGNAPYDLLKLFWETVPVYKSLRFPSRHFFFTVFALSGLGGLGLSVFKKPIVQILVLGVLTSELLWFGKQFIVLKPIPETRIDSKLVDLLQSKPTELYRWLPNFGVWIPPRDSLDFPASMQYKIFNASGYDVAVPKNYYEFADVIDTNPYANNILETDVQIPFLDIYNPFMDFLNIQYITIPFAYDNLQWDNIGRFKKIAEDEKRDWRIYKNRDAYPRYFLVRQAMMLPNRESVKDAIRKREVDLRKTVLYESKLNTQTSNVKTTSKNSKANSMIFYRNTQFTESHTAEYMTVYGNQDCEGKTMGNIEIIEYKRNSVKLKVITPCDMILVSSETEYPGWNASIDGKKTEIIEGNLAFRTIIVPEGEHEIEFWYFPGIWILGLSISFGTLTAIIVLDYHVRQGRIRS